MRFFPACSEGFRRLSLITALVVGPVLFGYAVYGYSEMIETGHNACIDIATSQEDACNGRPEAEQRSCRDKAMFEDVQCQARQDQRRLPLVVSWLGFALGAAISAYLVALCIRTVGWVYQGFRV